ncbi:DUF3857 domain-containing protein [Bacteroidales bacterium OttesenSCG-928-M06]|nr:DUF3857 domain-containing protein [Bacteroidales bacterium OttesenSCG-928-M06]
MKNVTVFILMIIIVRFPVYSQEKFTLTVDEISDTEITMTSYDADPDADALILYEIGKTSFVANQQETSFSLHMYKKSRIKIFNEEGIKYATIKIPYYTQGNKTEKIQNLKAITYNYENGELIQTPLDLNQVYEEGMTYNWKRIVFTMPDIKPGSIIEFEYTVISPFLIHLREWEFQHNIPVLYSGFEFRVTPFYEYVYILRGAKQFDVFDSSILPLGHTFQDVAYKEVKYYMAMQNIPAFKDEEFITSPSDHLISLSLQMSQVNWPGAKSKEIMTTWPAMCNTFLREDFFGKYLNAAEKAAKNILPELDLENKSQKEKIRMITEYVKQNYTWNNKSDKYTGRKIESLLKEKKGNSAELNLLLTGLLKKAEIPAKPVILSTRRHGAIPKNYPFFMFINYVIAYVSIDGEDYFLDATEPLLPFGELPERCINVDGLIVEKNSDQWIRLAQNNLSAAKKDIRISFNDPQMNVDITYETVGNEAYQYRIMNNEDKNIIKDIFNNKGKVSTSDITFENEHNPDLPFIFSWKDIYPYQGGKEKIILPPFLDHSLYNNIFDQKSRTLPVDMVYQKTMDYSSEITIPENYTIEYVPENREHEGNAINYEYKTEVRENKLITTAKYRFNKNIFDPEEYKELKDTYEQIIKLFNDPIILKQQ